MLRELFKALGNDPFAIAECLARPALAERNLAVVALRTQTNGGIARAEWNPIHKASLRGERQLYTAEDIERAERMHR